jgi:tRNA threonylcarbamoyladenosine biosynthesis protein TsaB
MKLLAVETSTMVGSVALCDGSTLIAEYQMRINATYSDTLFPVIDQLLLVSKLTIDDIEGYALAIGPGSFTALRIGMSIIKGLAFATEKPIVGVRSLDGLAQNVCFSNLLVCPIFDARKGEVYTALYKNQKESGLDKLVEEKVVSPDVLCAEIKEKVIFLGDGSDVYRERLQHNLGAKALFAPPHLRYPRASSVAHLAMNKFLQNEVSEADYITPLYVRPPEAEVKFSKR